MSTTVDEVGEAVEVEPTDTGYVLTAGEGEPNENAFVVTVDEIDPDRMIFEGYDTYREYKDKKGAVQVRGPIFTVSEMAKFFFARTNHWIRWIEASGKMAEVVKPGPCKTCGTKRLVEVGKDKQGNAKYERCPTCTVAVGARRHGRNNRIYTLGDVEQVAHALAANGSITGAQLRHTLRILRSQGEMYDIFVSQEQILP